MYDEEKENRKKDLVNNILIFNIALILTAIIFIKIDINNSIAMMSGCCISNIILLIKNENF